MHAAAVLPSRRMSKLVVALAFVAATAGRAHADDEPTDQQRLVHLAIGAALGTGYLVLEVGLNDQLAPKTCQWCNTDSFDVSVRDALRWGNTAQANTISNLTGYVLAPLSAVGLTALASDRSWRRRYDDVIPVVQSALVISLLDHVTKVAVARQRPYAHFAPPGTLVPSVDDNVSFFSGHTSLTFSLAVSAGVVTSRRGYKLAPVVWASGLALAATTGYLRIAADRHYVTDVLAGAAMGSLAGWAWPTLVHPHIQRDIEVVPTGQGMAIVGTF
jgi:membrane-associated phospholipid phosphatase